METTTAAEITADLQDFIYSVQHGARHAATLDEVMAGLMPLVERYATATAAPQEPRRYVVTYRDAGGFEWEPLEDERYDTPGDVLIARDRLISDEPEWLPRNRHHAVDLETGQILDWEDAFIDH